MGATQPPGLVNVDAAGMWVGSSLGFSWHCNCGWVSKRYPTDVEAIDAEVWPHMVDRHAAQSGEKGGA